MIKSRFRTIVISPMLQGVNILRTQGTLEMGDVPKSALQERAMPSVMVKMPTRNIQQRCGKYCLCKLKPLFEKNKIKYAYVRQLMLYKSVINIIPFLYEMRNTALCKA